MVTVYIIIGILLWLIMGFCAYILDAKVSYKTYFTWGDFLFTTVLGLISFIAMIMAIFISKFPNFMETLLKKINK